MTVDLATSLSLATPELILAVGAMALLMIGVFSGENSNTRVTGLAVALLIGAGAWLVLITGEGDAFNGAFVNDAFARFMKVLTLVGTIFIPLTFVVGIYGMNFDYMPELRQRFGYPLVMGAMAVLALVMVVWFRVRGWLGGRSWHQSITPSCRSQARSGKIGNPRMAK